MPVWLLKTDVDMSLSSFVNDLQADIKNPLHQWPDLLDNLHNILSQSNLII